MRLIILSAGHSNTPGRDRGASGNGLIEGEETVKIRNEVYKHLKFLGANVIIDGDNTIFIESINYFKKLTNKNAIVCEFHLNSGPSTAEGTETIVPKNYTLNEKNLARKISSTVAEILDIPLRADKGVRNEFETHHKKLAWMALEGENIMPELFFISNQNEVAKYKEPGLIQKLGKAIANDLYQFSKNSSFSEINTDSVVHTVRSGDTLSLLAQIYGVSIQSIKNKNGLTSDVIHIGKTLKIK